MDWKQILSWKKVPEKLSALKIVGKGPFPAIDLGGEDILNQLLQSFDFLLSQIDDKNKIFTGQTIPVKQFLVTPIIQNALMSRKYYDLHLEVKNTLDTSWDVSVISGAEGTYDLTPWELFIAGDYTKGDTVFEEDRGIIELVITNLLQQ